MNERLMEALAAARTEAEEHIHKGNELAAQGNEVAADEHFRKAVELQPGLALEPFLSGDGVKLVWGSGTVEDLERYLEEPRGDSKQ